MITFKKTKLGDLSKKIRDSIIKWDDDECIVDETKITAPELTALTAFLEQEGRKQV